MAMEALTLEEFKDALPANMRKVVNPLMVMRINNTLNSPEEWEQYRDNLLSYTHVLQQGKFRLNSYLSAVRYVSFKVMGLNNRESYQRTFPDRYEELMKNGVSNLDIHSYVYSYNRTKLVNLIFEQTLIPTHILNAPIFQQAINVQTAIMNDPEASFKVRSDAANSLLTHLKAPEVKKMELSVGIHKESIIEDYEVAMRKMVEQQLKLMEAGGDVKQITNAAIPVALGEDI